MASVESTTGSDEEEWPPSFYGSSQQSLPVAPTKTGWRRLLVCIGIKIFGKKQQDACDAVGISRPTFSNGGWLVDMWPKVLQAGVDAANFSDEVLHVDAVAASVAAGGRL